MVEADKINGRVREENNRTGAGIGSSEQELQEREERVAERSGCCGSGRNGERSREGELRKREPPQHFIHTNASHLVAVLVAVNAASRFVDLRRRRVTAAAASHFFVAAAASHYLISSRAYLKSVKEMGGRTQTVIHFNIRKRFRWIWNLRT
ncbi:hypothetical protein LWI29_015079 [Acer saccharum]|uniref:Uncharacterized protein n=1 Tax=Acer saccharum TaxID=4024 RepID=A0AA39RR94_ACESA|nr:hypothetical protein LWI29_015079 [Acer saccharum]